MPSATATPMLGLQDHLILISPSTAFSLSAAAWATNKLKQVKPTLRTSEERNNQGEFRPHVRVFDLDVLDQEWNARKPGKLRN